MLIRKEEPKDWQNVFTVNSTAFETDAEARLVETLRKQADPVISLVAEKKEEIVGHIMFSPVSIAGYPNLKLMGLGPMAVRPENQRTGIGSQLVKAGLKLCEESGFGAVVVLGHPKYYPRFDFVPSSQFEIVCEYDVPEGVFMVRELTAGYLDNVGGTVTYHEAFNSV